MSNIVTPYKDHKGTKKEQVATMFNNIAPKYDTLNQILSFGVHKGWRRKAIKLLKDSNPKQILDIATGTADFAIEAIKLNPDKVTGIDISEGMLNLGKEKIKHLKLENKIHLQLGDSENLKFDNNTFDAITVGFGVRNFENLEKGIKEIYRVMKPNATFVVLEFSKPKTFPIKQLYNFYFKYITPLIGKIISKDKAAYTYLPESVNAFPEGKDFLAILEKNGFNKTKAIPLVFGIASIYYSKK